MAAGNESSNNDRVPTSPAQLSLSLPNVITASHLASASPTAARRLRETVASIAVAALRGEKLPNVVNGVA